MRKLRRMEIVVFLGIMLSLVSVHAAAAQSELKTKVEELADQLTSSNAGEVAGVEGSVAYINLGEKDGVYEGAEFEVVRLGAVMMVGNKAMHKEKPVGEIRITKVRKDMSLAKITTAFAAMEKGDKVYQKQKKAKRIALTEFAYGGSVNNLSKNVYESLAVLFARKGLQVVERSQLDKILREQKIAHSGMIDISTAQKLGQMLGTEAVLLGTVTDIGNGVALRARWVDAAKGVVIAAAEVEVTKTPQLAAMLGAERRDTGGSVEPAPEIVGGELGQEPGQEYVGASPQLGAANQFITGLYTADQGGRKCTVTTGKLLGGRVEVAMSCEGDGAMSASWATGPIKGHPFELDLRGAEIDKIPGHENYSWGKVASSPHYAWWSCFFTGKVMSARQVGSSIALSCYEKNIQKGGVTLVKQSGKEKDKDKEK